MAMNYEAIEEALRVAIVDAFPDRMADERCKVGDIDEVYRNIMISDPSVVTDGCVIDFGGGTNQPRQTLGTIHWAWILSCVYLIRYTESVEQDLRTVVQKLPVMFQGNQRLGNTTPLAYVTEIGDPGIASLNDTKFYMIPFFIEALDRSV